MRRNRVVMMLTDDELAKLRRLAEEWEIPLNTAGYVLLGRALKRQPSV